MIFSYKLKINTQRVKKDETAALYFQVIINRKITTIPLDLHWSINHFDHDAGKILPLSKKDKMHEDYTREIERKGSDINEVFIWARLAEVTLTIDRFKKELKNKASRNDFVKYYKEELERRFKKGIIKKSTYTVQKNNYTQFTEFRQSLIFSEISKSLLEEFRSWMINKKKYDNDTIWIRFKDLKTYLNAAANDGYYFESPFKNFQMPKTQSRIEYLTEDEFQKLYKYFYSEDINKSLYDLKTVLRAFLFSCFTGLRISDVKIVKHSDVYDDLLIIKPKKQQLGANKEITIPLCKEAQKLIVTAKGCLVETITEAAMNRYLKIIAKNKQIKKNITFHWSRHTFAMRFLRRGGRIEVLKELLGHGDIKTTMVYVHVDTERLKHEISFLDNLTCTEDSTTASQKN